MRNFNNFKNVKNFFSSFRQNPNVQKVIKNPITLIFGINTALYVSAPNNSDSLETKGSFRSLPSQAFFLLEVQHSQPSLLHHGHVCIFTLRVLLLS